MEGFCFQKALRSSKLAENRIHKVSLYSSLQGHSFFPYQLFFGNRCKHLYHFWDLQFPSRSTCKWFLSIFFHFYCQSICSLDLNFSSSCSSIKINRGWIVTCIRFLPPYLLFGYPHSPLIFLDIKTRFSPEVNSYVPRAERIMKNHEKNIDKSQHLEYTKMRITDYTEREKFKICFLKTPRPPCQS